MRYVMVSGSRGWGDYDTILGAFEHFDIESGDQLGGITLIQGCAAGADSLAFQAAHKLGWKNEPHPADWDKYGKSAGIRRNLEMLDRNPEFVFIFWDGTSRGTKHVIDEVQRRGIPHHVWIKRADDDPEDLGRWVGVPAYEGCT